VEGEQASVATGPRDALKQLGIPPDVIPVDGDAEAWRLTGMNRLEQALDLCETLDAGGSPVLGLAVDVYHTWWDPKLREGIGRAGRDGRLLAFHVSDWLVPTRDLLLDRGMMGDGVIDLPGIRAWVEEAGYAGAIEVEIFSRDDWWRRPAQEILSVCAQRLQSVC
jgi:sugar phosphate isomerase/epimerase